MYPPLIDVLQFWQHHVAVTADVSYMYGAVELALADHDLCRFVWRSNSKEVLKDCRMTRITFSVSALSFAANMAVKQNAIDPAYEYPLPADVIEKSFYVDDCLSGADNRETAIKLLQQLHDLLAMDSYFRNGIPMTPSFPKVFLKTSEIHDRFTIDPPNL